MKELKEYKTEKTIIIHEQYDCILQTPKELIEVITMNGFRKITEYKLKNNKIKLCPYIMSNETIKNVKQHVNCILKYLIKIYKMVIHTTIKHFRNN